MNHQSGNVANESRSAGVGGTKSPCSGVQGQSEYKTEK